MKKIILVLTLATASCRMFDGHDRLVKELNVQRDYRCTDKQWQTVEKEANYCANTIVAYSKSHCFDSAIVRNCDARKQ